MRELPDISVLIKSTQDLTDVDLSWAKEVIDSETKRRINIRMEQERYTKQQQVRAVPRISEYERTPEALDVRANAGQTPEWNDARTIADKHSQGGVPLHVSESGATSSYVPLRYDLIPRQLLECAAARYSMGVAIHGERGYQRGLGDRDFIINRINHITEHWNKILHPHPKENYSDVEFYGNVGAILWGLGFLLEVQDYGPGKQVLQDIFASGMLKK
jgi:hypothetical protein